MEPLDYILIISVCVLAFFFLQYFLKRQNYLHRDMDSSADDMSNEQRITKESLVKKAGEYTILEKKGVLELEHKAQFGQLSQGILHDLMNPLSALALHIERMQPSQAAEVPTYSTIHSIKNISQKMNSYIEHTRSALQHSSLPIEKEYTELRELMRELTDLYSFVLRTEHITLTIQLPESLKLPLAPVRAYQLFMNIITNAIEALREVRDREKRIAIQASVNESGIQISVRDNGVGFRKKDMHKAGNNSFTTKRGGSGIGLMTISYIVEKEMKGTIEIQSEENVGTTINIRLPATSSLFL